MLFVQDLPIEARAVRLNLIVTEILVVQKAVNLSCLESMRER
jgi:hypothetical protein